ncbi:DUF1080 domain-containing protein [Phycisphaeraceae bacterium D3-23]
MRTRHWIMGLGLATLSAAVMGCANNAKATGGPDADDSDGWVVLFDGSNTDHWRGYRQDGFPDRGWGITDDGELHKIAGAGGGDIITRESYDSFELAWEWRVAEGANSGVMYHVAEADDLGATYLTGPEYQILEDENHGDGRSELTSSGALYALIACNDKKELAPVGEWNTSRILVEGNHVEHWLNGEQVVEYELESDELAALIAGSKFKDWPRFAREGEGHIALQDHGDDVWFRNIRIREIEE